MCHVHARLFPLHARASRNRSHLDAAAERVRPVHTDFAIWFEMVAEARGGFNTQVVVALHFAVVLL